MKASGQPQLGSEEARTGASDLVSSRPRRGRLEGRCSTRAPRDASLAPLRPSLRQGRKVRKVSAEEVSFLARDQP